jgi:integrase
MALLDAADPHSRPVFATLAGTGMRPGEAVALNWRDVNLGTATIRVDQSKTAAGVRQVDLPIGLAEELSKLKIRSRNTGPDDPVFVNGRGARQTKDNISRRLKSAMRRANRTLTREGIEPLAVEGVTPYSFRRTYSSLRAAR